MKDAIQSQYLAALEMLKEATLRCSEELWNRPEDPNPFWQVVYHTLFYTHLYLQNSPDDFVPWAKGLPKAHRLEESVEPLLKEEMLEYLDFCRKQVIQMMPVVDIDAASGFSWLPMNKLELQLYTIRHIQHHAGELYERLGRAGDGEAPWVGMQGG